MKPSAVRFVTGGFTWISFGHSEDETRIIDFKGNDSIIRRATAMFRDMKSSPHPVSFANFAHQDDCICIAQFVTTFDRSIDEVVESNFV